MAKHTHTHTHILTHILPFFCLVSHPPCCIWWFPMLRSCTIHTTPLCFHRIWYSRTYPSKMSEWLWWLHIWQWQSLISLVWLSDHCFIVTESYIPGTTLVEFWLCKFSFAAKKKKKIIIILLFVTSRITATFEKIYKLHVYKYW